MTFGTVYSSKNIITMQGTKTISYRRAVSLEQFGPSDRFGGEDRNLNKNGKVSGM